MSRWPVRQPCGTVGACVRHRRMKETPCDACLDAWADYMAEWRIARKDRT